MWLRRRSRERARCQPIASLNAAEDDSPTATLPPLQFAATLSDIFGEASKEDPEFKKKLEAPSTKKGKRSSTQSTASHRRAGTAGSIASVGKGERNSVVSQRGERNSTVSRRHAASIASGGKLFDPPPLPGENEDESDSERKPKQKKDPGELRPTDVRMYGTLDNLLSNGFKPPSPPRLSPPTLEASKAGTSTERHGAKAAHRGTVDFDDNLNVVPVAPVLEQKSGKEGDLGAQHSTSSRGRRKSEHLLQRRMSPGPIEAHAGHVRRKSVEASHFRHLSARPSHFSHASTGPSQSRRHSVHPMTSSKSHPVTSSKRRGHGTDGFGSSSESHSEAESEDSEENRAVLDELMGAGVMGFEGVSNDWQMLLTFSKERMIDKRSSIELCGHHVEESSGIWHVEEARRGSGFDHFGAANRQSVSARPMTQPATSSWKVRDRSGARSPLRPGVYVGHEAPEHAKLNSQGRKPKGLPGHATAAQGSTGRFRKLSPDSRPATSQVLLKAREAPTTEDGASPIHTNVWHAMLAKLEDDGKTEESRAYDAWRKRVLECTRTMTMEAARFKTEDF